MRTGAVVRTVLRTELLQLLRDRRAVFSAVLLPALLYPLIFWAQGELEDMSRETLASREVHALVDLDGIDAELAGEVRRALEQRTPIQVSPVDADELLEFERASESDDAATRRTRREAVELLRGAGHLLVTAEPHPSAPRRTLFRLYFDVKDDVAREARERATAALDEVAERHERLRRVELLAPDPARGLDLALVDIASPEDASGATLGMLLPLLAVLVLLSGGSYAALAVFAGEREAGTLETLLVQPVRARAITWGKFAAVLVAGLVTLFANLGSLAACTAAGLSGLPGSGGVGWARLATGVVYLPGCVLLCAVLCFVCGKARTFREGQQTILPVMIATLMPTAIAMQPGLEHNVLLASIPFAGPALSLRDALRGELTLLPTLAMFASHAVWSWLVLGRLASLLDAERVLSSASTESESARRHLHSRHALRWAFAIVLVHYVVGGRLQAWNLELGLALSLWVLFPLGALLCARRRRGERAWFADLRLAPPPLVPLVGALLCVPALVFGMRQLLELQETLLPLPRSMTQASALTDTLLASSSWKLLFLFAITPGICEELFFRGAILSGLRRDLSPARAVAWQAFFFAAAHASVHRLLPTGLIGILLGVLTLRTRSLWPAILVHITYNGIQVLDGTERLAWTAHVSPHWSWLAVPGLALLCVRRADANR